MDQLIKNLFTGAETHIFSGWLFVRLLGCIYGIAFLSLAVQVRGLSGKNGISPCIEYITEQAAIWERKRFWALPTIFWIDCGDRCLICFCWIGVALSLLLVIGLMPALALLLLWLMYLSLFSVCRPWLGYQWDVLLLETGFLAIFFAPQTIVPEWPSASAPPKMILWLFYWLLFRLMFSSGVTKLKSGDPTWRKLTALAHHYETQPLPTPIAWHMHQTSIGFHKFSARVMFAIEVIVPMFIFGPPSLRYAAALATVLLMVLIALTGNYCFFNLLTVVLAVLLVDDSVWRKIIPSGEPHAAAAPWSWPVMLVVTLILVLLSIDRMMRLLHRGSSWLTAFARPSEPFHLVNSYGLFSVMTIERPEIVVEGSKDGREWRAYEFKYKPGDLRRRLPWVAPHQPRLDWQMWFAALGDYRANAWFVAFLIRLLQGKEEVLRLLRSNPFPDAPPIYVRAVLYQYRFTSRKERKETGAIWKRERQWLYCPVYSLKGKEESLMPPKDFMD